MCGRIFIRGVKKQQRRKKQSINEFGDTNERLLIEYVLILLKGKTSSLSPSKMDEVTKNNLCIQICLNLKVEYL